MKTAILLTTFASIACLQIVSAAYWTVTFSNSPSQNGKYYSKYQYWKTSFAPTEQATEDTKLVCSFSQGNDDKSLLFNQPSPPYVACEVYVVGSPFPIAVRPVGSDTELYALAVAYGGDDIPCAIMEYGTGFKTYICSNLMPVVNTNVTTKPSTTETAIVTIIKPSTTVTKTTETAIVTTTKPATAVTKTTLYTTTNKPTTTEASCKSGFRGKRNGQGPNGACCSHSDDCKDTCVKGTCGVSP